MTASNGALAIETLHTKGLVTNYGERGGGGYITGGGTCEVLPLQKRGGGSEKVLAMLKGGTKKFRGSLNAVA